MISRALPIPCYKGHDPSGLGHMDLGRSAELFWRNLSIELDEREWRPARLARELGITAGAISKWKSGNPPTLDMVDKVAACLGVTTAYLLRDPDVEPRQTLDPQEVYRFLGKALGIKHGADG